MRKEVRRTGPFGIGTMIHVIHVAEDVPTLNAFYEDVFGGIVYNGVDVPGYMAQEKRSASLVLVSDYCIETIAPDFPLDLSTAFARFYERCGPHLHSFGYVADDLEGIAEHHEASGVPISMVTTNNYSFFFTSPKHTGGFIVEFISDEMPNDPRMRDEWSSLRKVWVNHPLGIEGMSHLTIGVRDLGEACATIERLWAAELLSDGVDETMAAQVARFRLGDSVIELAEPTSPSGRLGAHVERFGTMLYAVTFLVRDLEAVDAHLASKSIRSEREGDQTVLAAPDDCHGAHYRFTTVPALTL